MAFSCWRLIISPHLNRDIKTIENERKKEAIVLLKKQTSDAPNDERMIKDTLEVSQQINVQVNHKKKKNLAKKQTEKNHLKNHLRPLWGAPHIGRDGNLIVFY